MARKNTKKSEKIKNIEIISENTDVVEHTTDNVIEENEKKSKDKLKDTKIEISKSEIKSMNFEVGSFILFDMPKEFSASDIKGPEFDGHFKGEIIGETLKFVRVIHKDGTNGITIPLMIIKDKCNILECL